MWPLFRSRNWKDLTWNHSHFYHQLSEKDTPKKKKNFGVYRPANYKGHIQTLLSRLHLDGDSNPGPPGRRSRALPQSYIPAIHQKGWPDTISNKELWQYTKQKQADQQIEKKTLETDWPHIAQASQPLTSQVRLSAGIHKGKGRGKGQETPGDAISRLTSRGWAKPRDSCSD